MSDDEQNLRTLLKARVEAASRSPAGHPPLETLEAFAEGALPPEEERRIREHLPLCRDCTDFVLALGDLQAPGESGEVPAEEVASAWGDLQEEIRRGTPAPPPSASPRWPLLLAAALALLAVGLSVWCLQLRRENFRLAEQARSGSTATRSVSEQLAEERRRVADQGRQIAELRRNLEETLRPRINTPIFDLAPRSRRSGAAPEEPVLEIPASADLFTLVLEAGDSRSYPAYSVEILDAQGKVLWNLEGLTRSEFGNFTVTLARRDLPDGKAGLRLYGEREGPRTRIGEYIFLIRDE